MGFRPPSNGPDSLHGLARASPATSQGPFVPGTSTNDGFAPGHPLVKDGRRHYGSKKLILLYTVWNLRWQMLLLKIHKLSFPDKGYLIKNISAL